MLKQYLSLSRTVHVLCLGALVNRAGAFLVPFLTLYLRESLGLGVGFATMAMGVFGVGALVASLVGGYLADRIGRKPVMLISLFGAAGMLVVFGMLTTPKMIIAGVFAFSVLSEMYRPAASAMIADVTDSHERTRAFSLMYVAINLGFAVAASVGGFVAEISFQWLFWGDALTAAVYGLLILILIVESMPSHVHESKKTISTNEPEVDSSDAPADSAPVDASLAAAVRHLIRDRVFLMFCVATFVLSVMYMQSISTFPIFLSERGIGARTYGLIMALNGALIVFLQLPLTSFVTRFHRGWMMALSAIIVGSGFALFGVASAPWHFALAVVVWTMGEMIGFPLSSAIVSDLAPQQFRARYMGVFMMSFSSSMIVGAPLGGLVLRQLGGATLWGLCGLLGIAAALVHVALRRRLLPPASQASHST